MLKMLHAELQQKPTHHDSNKSRAFLARVLPSLEGSGAAFPAPHPVRLAPNRLYCEHCKTEMQAQERALSPYEDIPVYPSRLYSHGYIDTQLSSGSSRHHNIEQGLRSFSEPALTPRTAHPALHRTPFL